MSKFVEGFVFPVSKKNVRAYIKMAKDGARIWKKFGALEYYECQGVDLKTHYEKGMGRSRSFTAVAKATKNDTVWLSFIVYRNRAHRDAVNKKVMAYMGKKYANLKDFTMPFDPKKMAKGGFTVEVVS